MVGYSVVVIMILLLYYTVDLWRSLFCYDKIKDYNKLKRGDCRQDVVVITQNVLF